MLQSWKVTNSLEATFIQHKEHKLIKLEFLPHADLH